MGHPLRFGVVGSLLLSVGAVCLMTSQAPALSVDLTGGPVLGYPGSGTAAGENNVVNSGQSGLVDGANGGNLVGSTAITSAAVSVSGTGGGFWGVNWWFAGAESGDQIGFFAQSTVGINTATFAELNQNNNCATCGPSPAIGPTPIGTTFQQGDGLINFLVRDLTVNPLPNPLLDHAYVNNAVPSTNDIPNTDGRSSLVFAYLTPPQNAPTTTDTLATTLTQSLWFMFAFNDNGSSDDNHDDFVGFAQVFFVPDGGQIPGVPLPPALVLFGSALVGLTLLGRRRRRLAS